METEKTVAVRIGEIVGTVFVGVIGALAISGMAYVVLTAWRLMGFVGG